MPSGIGQDKVRQYLDSTSAERNGLLQGGERRLFEVIDKEYSKLFRKDGAMTSLRKDFVRQQGKVGSQDGKLQWLCGITNLLVMTLLVK